MYTLLLFTVWFTYRCIIHCLLLIPTTTYRERCVTLYFMYIVYTFINKRVNKTGRATLQLYGNAYDIIDSRSTNWLLRFHIILYMIIRNPYRYVAVAYAYTRPGIVMYVYHLSWVWIRLASTATQLSNLKTSNRCKFGRCTRINLLSYLFWMFYCLQYMRHYVTTERYTPMSDSCTAMCTCRTLQDICITTYMCFGMYVASKCTLCATPTWYL